MVTRQKGCITNEIIVMQKVSKANAKKEEINIHFFTIDLLVIVFTLYFFGRYYIMRSFCLTSKKEYFPHGDHTSYS